MMTRNEALSRLDTVAEDLRFDVLPSLQLLRAALLHLSDENPIDSNGDNELAMQLMGAFSLVHQLSKQIARQTDLLQQAYGALRAGEEAAPSPCPLRRPSCTG
ncbi:MAG: hypothetical protein K6E31_01340 [bacterium]|nr:hypothetical protein [bacterium]